MIKGGLRQPGTCGMLAVSGPGREKGSGYRAGGHGAWTRARPMERKQLRIRLEDRKEGRVQAKSEASTSAVPSAWATPFREVLSPILAR